MHKQKFLSTGSYILAATLILSVFTGITQAQNPNLMPPVPIPRPNRVIVNSQIRIINARLTNIGPSHVFEITFEPYLWMGLDEDSNPIKYNYPQGSELIEQTPAQEFMRYSRDLTAYAYIYLDYSKKPIVSKTLRIKKADEPITYKLGLIQANQRILPGIYRISIQIQVNSQSHKNRDYIWIEESKLNMKDYIETKRVSPRRAANVQESAVIVITGQQNEIYKSLRVGEVYYYSSAISRVEAISKLIEEIKMLKKQRKESVKEHAKNEDAQVNIVVKRLLPIIHRKEIELMETQFFKNNLKTIKKELAKANIAQDEFNKYLTEYNKSLRTICIEITTDVQNMYMDMWWTGNLCLPNWSPDEKYGTLKELRKKWKISRFLKGKLDTEEVKGNWKKEEWVKWMQEEWLPKFTPILEKFRKFFGDQSLPEEHRWFNGLTENLQNTFWFPKNATPYNEMKKLFSENYMKSYGMAVGNLLAYYHAEDKRNADFPFISDKYNKPSPGPLSFKTYFQKLKVARRNFLRAFAPKIDPTIRPDPKTIKKRKYYVSKNGLYIGPLEYDPITGERNNGPFDESILNPKGDISEE